MNWRANVCVRKGETLANFDNFKFSSFNVVGGKYLCQRGLSGVVKTICHFLHFTGMPGT